MAKLPSHLGGNPHKKRKPAHVDIGIYRHIRNFYFKKFDRLVCIDLGCGTGEMVKAINEEGDCCVGMDGDPISVERGILREHIDFIRKDFTTQPIKLGQYCPEFVWSVEFLEHVEEKYIPNFTNLFQTARAAFITAAPPGQRGWHHVNCQPKEYWIGKFVDLGFMHDDMVDKQLLSYSTYPRDTTGRWAGKPTVIERNGMFFYR